MVDTALMIDPVAGVVAVYDEPNTTGSPFDPNAARNAPLHDLAGNFDKVRYHSAADHFEQAFQGTATVAYASVPHVSIPSSIATAYGTDAGGRSDILFAHNLGYLPYAVAEVNGIPVYPGMPIQVGVDGAARYATIWVDETYIGVDTICTVGDTDLAAASIGFDYLIFKKPPAPSGDVLFEFDAESGITKMGLDQVSSDRLYLQVAPGGSPFGIPMGRSIDLDNGAPKEWMADGSTYSPVQSSLKSYLAFLDGNNLDLGGESYGNPMTYGGAYAGPTFINLQLGPNTGLPDGVDFEGGDLTVNYGGVQVISTGGRLVAGLPDADDFIATVPLTYADPDKNWLYNFRWAYTCTNTLGPTWNARLVGAASIGAKPGTDTSTTVLAAAPAGSNFVIGHVRINRTTDPASTWLTQTIGVKLPVNKWIPLFGSLLLEEQVGLARAASIYIDGAGNLVLHQQQSVSVPPFWAVTSGNGGDAAGVRVDRYGLGGLPGTPIVGNTYSAGEWAVQVEVNKAWLPVVSLGSNILSGSVSGGSIDTTLERTTANGFVGSNARSVADTTDHTSVYSLELKLKFCRLAA